LKIDDEQRVSSSGRLPAAGEDGDRFKTIIEGFKHHAPEQIS
jgi:hypothetical protein